MCQTVRVPQKALPADRGPKACGRRTPGVHLAHALVTEEPAGSRPIQVPHGGGEPLPGAGRKGDVAAGDGDGRQPGAAGPAEARQDAGRMDDGVGRPDDDECGDDEVTEACAGAGLGVIVSGVGEAKARGDELVEGADASQGAQAGR